MQYHAVFCLALRCKQASLAFGIIPVNECQEIKILMLENKATTFIYRLQWMNITKSEEPWDSSCWPACADFEYSSVYYSELF